MKQKEMMRLIQDISSNLHLDPNLCISIAIQESNLDSYRTRYEPKWRHLLDTLKYSKLLGVTLDTELIHQSTSWGAMQIMGSVARELGYLGHLTSLTIPELGIHYGCMKLKSIQSKYPDLADQISAYNAGSPIRINGIYKNIDYINDVLSRLNRLKLI